MSNYPHPVRPGFPVGGGTNWPIANSSHPSAINVPRPPMANGSVFAPHPPNAPFPNAHSQPQFTPAPAAVHNHNLDRMPSPPNINNNYAGQPQPPPGMMPRPMVSGPAANIPGPNLNQPPMMPPQQNGHSYPSTSAQSHPPPFPCPPVRPQQQNFPPTMMGPPRPAVPPGMGMGLPPMRPNSPAVNGLPPVVPLNNNMNGHHGNVSALNPTPTHTRGPVSGGLPNGQVPQWQPPPVNQQGKYPQQQQPAMMAGQGDPNRPLDLLQERDVFAAGSGSNSPTEITLPRGAVENPETHVPLDVFRCTLGNVPKSNDLLKQCRLPFGLVLQPFRDMKSLHVLETQTIVRCRSCRTYINPYVQITDPRHWRCNCCHRSNDLPDEFNWDPVSRSYGEPQRRPEIKYATVEYKAPNEYMPVRKNRDGQNTLRAPQAAMYLFILDVSAHAVDIGYLHTFSTVLRENVLRMPGDERTSIGFMTVDSSVRFYNFTQTDQLPTEMLVNDLDDVFSPLPPRQPNAHSKQPGLLVNLSVYKEAVLGFLAALPDMFDRAHNTNNHSALGAALKIAHDLMRDNGGRISVMQSVLPDLGPGALTADREDPNMRAAGGDVKNLTPCTDFYKHLALECNGVHVCIDLFMLNSQYADLSTISQISQYSGGCIHYFAGAHILRNGIEMKRYEYTLRRYFTRRLGMEAVLRIRCTRGLSLRQFFGNFFVRSTDLLALPNINPDTSLGVQVEYEDSLNDAHTVSFQAALLYTHPNNERRIRVHTLCLPVTKRVQDVFEHLDVLAMTSMLCKFSSERSLKQGCMQDAKDALITAVCDALAAFLHNYPVTFGPQALLAPQSGLRLLPSYVLAMLKSDAFSGGGRSIKLDSRVACLCDMRSLPVDVLAVLLHPDLYALHHIMQTPADEVPMTLPLSYEQIDRGGVYLMDCGLSMFVYVGQDVSSTVCQQLFGANSFAHVEEDRMELPELEDSEMNARARELIEHCNTTRPVPAVLRIIRDDSPARDLFIRRLIEDRTESSHSYIEFLQYIKKEIPPKK